MYSKGGILEMKTFIKSVFYKFGFDLRRLNPNSNPTFQLLKALNWFNVDLVIDVGANVGQFASELRLVGYRGRIVSFEPIFNAYQELLKKASHDPLWQVYPRCAVGDKIGKVKINIAANSVSSSILPMTQSHLDAAPDSCYIDTEEVQMITLDSVSEEILAGSKVPFLKIDVQGYEMQVLNGAMQTLPKICGILCELSLVELYEGQKLWIDIIRWLEDKGFALWAIQNGFTDPRNGRTLQVDAIFFRIQQ